MASFLNQMFRHFFHTLLRPFYFPSPVFAFRHTFAQTVVFVGFSDLQFTFPLRELASVLTTLPKSSYGSFVYFGWKVVRV